MRCDGSEISFCNAVAIVVFKEEIHVVVSLSVDRSRTTLLAIVENIGNSEDKSRSGGKNSQPL